MNSKIVDFGELEAEVFENGSTVWTSKSRLRKTAATHTQIERRGGRWWVLNGAHPGPVQAETAEKLEAAYQRLQTEQVS